MIIVAYYTSDTPYEQVAKSQLIPSLNWWKLKHDVVSVPAFNNWSEATGYKSKFILQMLLKHQEPIVCLDVDAYVLQYPHILMNIPHDIDVAYHDLDWNLQWKNIEGESRRELLSGTIYFKYNNKVLSLLNRWINDVQKEINTPEQLILQRIMTSKHDYRVLKLPVEYCTVLHHDNTIPNYVKSPVILHTQASRKFKNKRNW